MDRRVVLVVRDRLVALPERRRREEQHAGARDNRQADREHLSLRHQRPDDHRAQEAH